jgi:hypothetical protein
MIPLLPFASMAFRLARWRDAWELRFERLDRLLEELQADVHHPTTTKEEPDGRTR